MRYNIHKSLQHTEVYQSFRQYFDSLKDGIIEKFWLIYWEAFHMGKNLWKLKLYLIELINDIEQGRFLRPDHGSKESWLLLLKAI